MNLENFSKKSLWDRAFLVVVILTAGFLALRFGESPRALVEAIRVHDFLTPKPRLVLTLSPPILAALAIVLSGIAGWGFSSKRLGVLLLFVACGIYCFGFSHKVIPQRAKHFFEVTEIRGNLWTTREWRDALNDNLGLREAPASIADVAWLPLSEGYTALNSGNWLAVFENNVSQILLRKSERNAANFARVLSYYQRQRLPFDPHRGINVTQIYQTHPSWILGMEEKVKVRWFDTSRTVLNAITDANYYLSRSIGHRAVERLREALDEFPQNPFLIVRLSQILLGQNNVKEAQRWLEKLDREKIPDEILPSVQQMNYALLPR